MTQVADSDDATTPVRIVDGSDGTPAYLLERIVTPDDAERLALNTLGDGEIIPDEETARFHVRSADTSAPICHAVLTLTSSPERTARDYTLNVSVANGSNILEGNPPALSRALRETVLFAKTTFASEHVVWQLNDIALIETALSAGFAIDTLNPAHQPTLDRSINDATKAIQRAGTVTMGAPGRVNDVRQSTVDALRQPTNVVEPTPSFSLRSTSIRVGSETAESAKRRDFGPVMPVDVRGTETERQARVATALRQQFPELGHIAPSSLVDEEFIALDVLADDSTPIRVALIGEPMSGNAIDATALGLVTRRITSWNHVFPNLVASAKLTEQRRHALRELEEFADQTLPLDRRFVIDDPEFVSRTTSTKQRKQELLKSDRSSLESLVDAELAHALYVEELCNGRDDGIVASIDTAPRRDNRLQTLRTQNPVQWTKVDSLVTGLRAHADKLADRYLALASAVNGPESIRQRSFARRYCALTLIEARFWADELAGQHAYAQDRRLALDSAQIDFAVAPKADFPQLVARFFMPDELLAPRFRPTMPFHAVVNGLLGIDNVRTGEGSMHGFIPVLGEKMRRIEAYDKQGVNS